MSTFLDGHVDRRPRRAVLVVPASKPRMVAKALASPADEVVLDLEDAVSIDRKAFARSHAAEVLGSASPEGPVLSVRVNGTGTPWFDDDLAMLVGAGPMLTSVVVPKAESATDIHRIVDELCGAKVSVQALIESARGVATVADICAVRGVAAVIIGYADLAADLGRSRGLPPHRWTAIQDNVLIAARAAGVTAIDGPHLGVADDDEFRSAIRWARDAGFDGKWVIHPAQLGAVLTEFSPSAEEIAYARGVLSALAAAEAGGDGAVQWGGHMLDEALAVAARRTLARVANVN